MGAVAELCLERHFSAERLNELANHPDIRPTCGGDGQSYLDLAPFVANPNNHAMVWEHGAMLFQWSAPETYEIHVLVEPEGRGPEAYRMAREAIDRMIEQGAERLWARISGNAALRHYTTQAGLTKWGTDTVNIGFGPVTYDIYQWSKPCRPH